MTNFIKVFSEGFVLVNEKEHVIGVVCKANDTQWQFMPLVPGKTRGVYKYINLEYALQEAIKFEVK